MNKPKFRATAKLGSNIFVAINAGKIGNSISLHFTGLMDVQETVANWNADNEDNMVDFTGDGFIVPRRSTIRLSGGRGC